MKSLRLALEFYKEGSISRDALVNILNQREELLHGLLKQASDDMFEKTGASSVTLGRLQKAFGKLRHNNKIIEKQLSKSESTVSTLRQQLLNTQSQNQKLMDNTGKKGLKEFLGFGAKLLALSTGLGAGFAGVEAGLQFAANKRKDSIIKDSNKKIYDMFPELKDNKTLTQEHFNTIAKIAPDLASSPVIAGTILKKTVEYGHLGTDTITQLIRTQKDLEGTQRHTSPIMSALRSATGMASGLTKVPGLL